ncbi:MAG: CpsD/CapB family tyrosine-protein kinase [Acidimicrobiia bacterium]|nr:CpsD/CapB family tyrosine-protein kinase [Acidimicrobiia bacterium]
MSDLILELASSAERVPAGVGAAPSPGGNGRGWAPHGEHGTPLEAALVGTEEPNLLVLPAGSIPPNPSELLASPHATELLDELGALVDVVILDTPPVLPVTDAAILAAKSDGVVLVAVPGETTRTAAQRARETLGNPQVRLLGLVLNKYRGPGPSDYRYGTDDASMTVKPWHGAKKRREAAASTATAR